MFITYEVQAGISVAEGY